VLSLNLNRTPRAPIIETGSESAAGGGICGQETEDGNEQ